MCRKIVLLILLTSIGFTGKAQEEDLRTWLSVGLEGELFDLVDFSFTPELRLMENSSTFDAILGEVDLSIPATKFLRLGLEYRYKLEGEYDDQFSNSNRFGIYGELDHRIKRFRMAYRAMYLKEYTDITTSELGYIPQSLHRHKVSLKYRKKKSDFTPGLAFEGFFMLSPGWLEYRQKFRLTAGLQYRLTKDLDIGISYKLQKEFFENNPRTSHILCAGIEYSL